MVDLNIIQDDMNRALSHNPTDILAVIDSLKVAKHVPNLIGEIKQLRQDLREMYELTKEQRHVHTK